MLLASEIFALAASGILPIVLFVYIDIKLKSGWKWVLWGAAAYIVFYMLIELSFLQFLNTFDAFAAFASGNMFGYILLLALLEAFLQEGGTWLIFLVMKKSSDTMEDAGAYGIGLWGTEALLLVGVTALELILSTNVTIAPSLIFFSGLERLLMLAIRVGLAMMVMKAIQTKKFTWWLYAFLIHFGVTFIGLFINNVLDAPLWALSLILLICAIAMGYFVIKQWNLFKEEEKARLEAEKIAAAKWKSKQKN